MSPKSLFNIILKIFGLFFIKEIVSTIPQLFSAVLILLQANSFDHSQTFNYELAGITIPVIIFSFYILLTYLLLFKTNNIIAKLKLDKGFSEEEFSYNLSSRFFLTVAIFVIGSIILLNEYRFFLKLYSYTFRKKV